MELGSFPEVRVCLQTSFFPQKLSDTCVVKGGGVGTWRGREKGSFFLSVLQRTCFSENRGVSYLFSPPIPFSSPTPALLGKPFFGERLLQRGL